VIPLETAFEPEPGTCSLRRLPPEMHLEAAWHAAVLRPSNAPELVALAYDHPHDEVLPPAAITLLRSKFWPNGYQIKVAFQGGSPAINAKVLEFANHWSRWANVGFIDVGPGDQPDVLTSYALEGYWAYLGPDNRIVTQRMKQVSCNFQGFDKGTMPESEWYRVVEHEFGHILGAEHEHMRPEIVARIDPAKAYPYFLEREHWDKEMVDSQVLTPLDMTGTLASAPEETSIMSYWLSGSIMKDGRAVRGGSRITDLDGRTTGIAYPGRGPVHPQFRDFADALAFRF
jgi:hypothetical protein